MSDQLAFTESGAEGIAVQERRDVDWYNDICRQRYGLPDPDCGHQWSRASDRAALVDDQREREVKK